MADILGLEQQNPILQRPNPVTEGAKSFDRDSFRQFLSESPKLGAPEGETLEDQIPETIPDTKFDEDGNYLTDFEPLMPSDPSPEQMELKELKGQRGGLTEADDPNLALETMGGIQQLEDRGIQSYGLAKEQEQKVLDKFNAEMQINLAREEMGLGKLPVDLDTSVEDFGLGVDLGFSDNLQEQERTVLKHFPGADVQIARLTTGDELFVNLPGTNKYIPVKGWQTRMGEVAAMTPEIGVGVTTALGTGGLGIAGRVIAEGVAGAGYSAAKSAVQKERGIKTESAEEIAERAGKEGLINITGELGATAVQYTRSAMRLGGNMIRLDPDAAAAEEAAKRLGVDVPPTTYTPFGRRLENMAKALIPGAKKKAQLPREQIRMQINEMASLREQQFNELGRIPLSYTEAEEKVIKAAISNPKIVSDVETGKLLQDRIVEWEKDLLGPDGTVSKMYADLLSNAPDDLTFDTAAIKDAAGDIVSKNTAQGVEVAEQADELINIDLNPPEGKSVAQYAQGLTKLVDELAATGDKSAFEALKEARTKIGEKASFNKLYSDLSPEEKTYRKLYRGFTEAMSSPKSQNPEFIQQWAETSKAARAAYELRDMHTVQRILHSDTPWKIPDEMFDPKNAGAIVQVAGILEGDKLNILQDRFKTQLLSKPYAVREMMQEWSERAPKELDLLLSKREQKEFKFMADRLEELQNTVLFKNRNRMMEPLEYAEKLFREGSNAEMKAYLQAMGPEYKEFVQYGFMKYLKEASAFYDDGVTVVHPGVVSKIVTDLETRGILSETFGFDEKTIKQLKDVRSVSSFLNKAADPGASLQAASMAAEAFDLGALIDKDKAGSWFENIVHIGAVTLQADKFMSRNRSLGNNLIGRTIGLDPLPLMLQQKKGMITNQPLVRSAFISSLQFMDHMERLDQTFDMSKKKADPELMKQLSEESIRSLMKTGIYDSRELMQYLKSPGDKSLDESVEPSYEDRLQQQKEGFRKFLNE